MCEGGGPIILINTTTHTHDTCLGSIVYLYIMKLPPREYEFVYTKLRSLPFPSRQLS